VAEVRAALSGRLPVPQRARETSAQAWQSTVVQMDEADVGTSTFAPSQLPLPVASARRRARNRTLWSMALAMVVSAALGAWWAGARAPQAAPVQASAAPAAEQAASAVAATFVVTAEPTAPAELRDAARSETRGVVPSGATAPRAVSVQGGALAPRAISAQSADDAPRAVAVAPRGPREHCGGRHLIALHRCMVRECDKPEFSAHRDCAKVRDIEARTRDLVVN
jgi:hypothetical protein